MNIMEQVFVYGTLRPPRADTPAESSRFYPQIEAYIQACVPAELPEATLYDLGTYPAARPGDNLVQGDLLSLDPAALPIMDRLEGHPVFFQRDRISVLTASGAVEAWIYWAPEALLVAASRIPSGDWFDRQAQSTLPRPEPGTADPQLKKLVDRFASSASNWLNSVRPDGRAHSAPIWHVWHGGRIYVVTTADAVKVANIRQHPGVVIAHPDPASPVIIEGWATLAPAMRPDLIPLFKAKYDWDLDHSPAYNTIIEITPTRLLAWGDHGEGRWTGADLLKIRSPQDIP